MATTSQLTKHMTRLIRLRGDIRSFFFHDDFVAFILLVPLLLILPVSLDVAEWPTSHRVLIPTIVLSVVVGFALSRSQFNEFLSFVISMIYGFAVIIWLAATQLGFDVSIRDPNQDVTVLTMLIALLFWFLGFNSAWHTFRIDRVWRVIAPPGIILVSNVIFYSGDGNLDRYLLVYTFIAMLIVVRHNLDTREWEWYINDIHRPPQLRRHLLWLGVILSILPLLVGSSVPNADLQERSDSFWDFVQSLPNILDDLFPKVPTPASCYYGCVELQLGGAIRPGDQDVFYVEAPTDNSYYWKSRVFDTYEGGRWLRASSKQLPFIPFTADIEPSNARVAVQHKFTVALNATHILYAAPQAYEVNVPARVELFYTAEENNPSRYMYISAIQSLKVIRRGESYTVTSLVSTATADELRLAGTAYPEWVTNLYLYVSSSVTQRTRDLARQIVTDAGATNPYDQAKAIEGFLRTYIIYNESIPSPPVGRDPIDWVLFDHKQGYCVYYASSMIVMLRSLGIPARMAAGFAEGTYDAGQGAYIVTERDAHTWVEVYFPGYGWIEFEPTFVGNPPPSTATPTATPTPLPTATPLPTSTPADYSDYPPPPTALPTITPTFTSTSTATPVIIPTPTPNIGPSPSDNTLALIMTTIGMFLAGVLILFLLGVFIWWWWEWRGMRGLSLISRAYARLERYIGLIGVRHDAQDTTQERSKRMVSVLPRARKAIVAIVKMYTEERYRPQEQQRGRDERNATIVGLAWTDARGDILKRWARKFVPWGRGK